MKNSERILLDDLSRALDAWVHQYAPEQCDGMRVQEYAMMTFREGGTLAYIAALNVRIKAALKATTAGRG